MRFWGPALAVLLLALQAPTALSDGRRLLARDIPLATCANTVQGRSHIADDRGYLCPREQLDSISGCCLKGDQYSCHTCSSDDSCCSMYEQCVSCCMAPANNAKEAVKKVFRGPDREETGRWPSVFEYCRGKCRTSARSTVHENAYLAPDIHCFSDLGKPLTEETPVPELPAGVIAMLADKGETCAAACARSSLGCAVAALPAVNSCNVLRQHVPCEAGCGPHPSLGGLPGYVVSAADKPEQPTFCWTQPEGSESDHGCEAASPNIQRLCTCSKRNDVVANTVQ